jgi:hypothetical protein
MALKDADCKYYKITPMINPDGNLDNLDLYYIRLEVYLNEDARQTPPNEFTVPIHKNVHIDSGDYLKSLMNHTYDDEKSTVDNFLTASYIFLKTLDEFKDMVDC